MSGDTTTRTPSSSQLTYVSESLQDTDPCDNFYEYVCGNWSSKYRLQGEAVYSEAVMSTRELETELTSLFAIGTEDISSQAMFDLYNACLKMSFFGGEPPGLRELLKSVGLAGFPYTSSDGRASAAAGRLLRVTGVAPLLQVGLTDKGIQFIVPRTLFPDFTHLSNAHRGWYSDAVRRVARMPIPELFEFEQELVALLSSPPEPYVTVALADLASTAEWNWGEFLTNAASGVHEVTPATRVRLQPNISGEALVSLLSSTKPSVLLNYLAFRLVLAYAPLLPSKRFKKLSDVMVSYKAGWEDGWSERRAHTCTKMAARAEPELAAFLLVSHLKHEDLEAVLRGMAAHAKRSILDFLGEMSWVTSSFLSKVEDRFKMLEPVLFMPAEWKRVAFRMQQCRSFGCASGKLSAAGLFHEMAAQRQRRRMESSIGTFPVVPEDAFETEIRVVDENTLFVPLGVVRNVYSREAFWEYHLSRILLQLSAVLVDVFRDVASDLRQKYTDLYGRFAAAEKCLREARATMNEATLLPFSSNGTSREDLRDHLAVAAAHRMYRQLSGKEDPLSVSGLPGLPFSREQLFFVHLALSRCEKYDAAYEDQVLRHGRRAHAAYRINGPLRQTVGFARAFQCQRGSYMNPPLRCVF
ncbi:neprilysin-2-like [Haemaphysalis longicornis]